MGRLLRNVSMVLVAALAVLQLGACRRAEKAAPAEGGAVVASHAPSDLSWESQWAAATSRAKAEHKVVLVDFYADWCIWCKRLDATTYRDPKVIGYLSENTVPLKLDVDGAGRDLASRYRVDGLPTIVILSPSGEELGRIGGYLPADAFLQHVAGIVGVHAS